MQVGRVSLAEIGRQLLGPQQAKRRIKRCWRFTANQQVVEISDAMQGVIRWLLRRKRRQKKPLVIAVDWREVTKFHALMLSAAMKGRSIFLLWASYEQRQLHKSQNAAILQAAPNWG